MGEEVALEGGADAAPEAAEPARGVAPTEAEQDGEGAPAVAVEAAGSGEVGYTLPSSTPDDSTPDAADRTEPEPEEGAGTGSAHSAAAAAAVTADATGQGVKEEPDERGAGGDGADVVKVEASGPDAGGVRAKVGTVFLRQQLAGSAKLERARARILQDPWDPDAWESVAEEAQGRPLAEARELYEEVLERFPCATGVWRAYAEVEMQQATRDDDAIKKIFSRCLLTCKNVELWRLYMRFQQKVNDADTEAGAQAIKTAFEFSVDTVGEGLNSGPLWTAYVNFLRRVKFSSLFAYGRPGHEETQRVMEVRRAYQRAVMVPTGNLDALWKEYEAFETGQNKVQARTTVAEWSPKVAAVRAVLRDRQRHCAPIKLQALATPPMGLPAQEQQAKAWRGLIAFEVSNPQRLEQDELVVRVSLTYDEALCNLHLWPEIWVDYAQWLQGMAQTDAAEAVFERAARALPGCLLVRFAHADMLEARGNIAGARKVYEALTAEIEEVVEKESISREEADAAAAVDADGQPVVPPPTPLPLDAAELDALDRLALAYIQFMRFARRAEGKDASRKVFQKARKHQNCRSQVFVFAATLEYNIDNDSRVARNVFELGLKRYLTDTAFVLSYVDFLLRINDPTNARALFERAIGALGESALDARPIWDRYMQFEHQYGDLAGICAVERRRAESLELPPSGGAESIGLMLSRYSALDLLPCTTDQRSHFHRLGGTAAQILEMRPPPVVRAPKRGQRRAPAPADAGVSPVYGRPTAPVGETAAAVAAVTKPTGGAPAQHLKPLAASAKSSDLTKSLLLIRDIKSFASTLGPSAMAYGFVPEVDAVLMVIAEADLSANAASLAAASLAAGIAPEGTKRKADGGASGPPAKKVAGAGDGITAANARAAPTHDVFRLRQQRKA